MDEDLRNSVFSYACSNERIVLPEMISCDLTQNFMEIFRDCKDQWDPVFYFLFQEVPFKIVGGGGANSLTAVTHQRAFNILLRHTHVVQLYIQSILYIQAVSDTSSLLSICQL